MIGECCRRAKCLATPARESKISLELQGYETDAEENVGSAVGSLLVKSSQGFVDRLNSSRFAKMVLFRNRSPRK